MTLTEISAPPREGDEECHCLVVVKLMVTLFGGGYGYGVIVGVRSGDSANISANIRCW